MKPNTTLLATLVLVGAAAFPLEACSETKEGKPATQAEAQQSPETVVGEAYAEAEATIAAVDKDAREVTLQTASGESQVIEAPEDVDLDKLAVGDVVVFGVYERLSVKVLPAGSAPLGVATQTATAKAEPGATPGRGMGEMVTIIQEVASVDAANNTVTLRGADGNTRTLDVKNPENQERLKTLKVGDLVQIDLVEVVAVSLKPKG
ncbi:MAG: hypothetical protein IPM60_13615 [Rhodospirillales bacterium]|nr:hypothetical protein [Rhodospirillales bacterium]